MTAILVSQEDKYFSFAPWAHVTCLYISTPSDIETRLLRGSIDKMSHRWKECAEFSILVNSIL